MAAIQIGNVSEEIAFNDFTINVDLLDLAEIYDAGLIKFIYGQEPDLSDGQTLSQGMFALGSTSQVIDGLTEGETYYYKVVADTVSYNSDVSFDNAINESGFVYDLAGDEVEMDKITNSETNMEKITNSQIAMDKVTDRQIAVDKIANNYWIDSSNLTNWLLSPHIINTMWSKEMASEKFCNFGLTNGVWSSEIDFTDITSLKIKTRVSSGNSAYGVEIYIDGTEVFSEGSSHSWTDRTFDVTSYSGNLLLELKTKQSNLIVSSINGPSGGKYLQSDAGVEDGLADLKLE